MRFEYEILKVVCMYIHTYIHYFSNANGFTLQSIIVHVQIHEKDRKNEHQ